jgi:hypothetical protein
MKKSVKKRTESKKTRGARKRKPSLASRKGVSLKKAARAAFRLGGED